MTKNIFNLYYIDLNNKYNNKKNGEIDFYYSY